MSSARINIPAPTAGESDRPTGQMRELALRDRTASLSRVGRPDTHFADPEADPDLDQPLQPNIVLDAAGLVDAPARDTGSEFRDDEEDDDMSPRALTVARDGVPAGSALPVYDPYSARRRPTPEWLVNHVASLVIGDAVAAAVAVELSRALPLPGVASSRLVSLVAVAGWLCLQVLLGTYAERRLGTGVDEFRRILLAGLSAVCALSFADFLFRAPGLFRTPGLDRLVVVAVPAATVLTLIGRLLNRRRLQQARRRGLMTKRVVVVGRDGGVADLAARLRRDTAAGLQVVGACVPRPGRSTVLRDRGIPVLGNLDEVLRVVDQVRADAVLVASTSDTAAHYLRDLTWRLEGTNIEVLVGPGVVEVAPNRLYVRPTMSVSLMQIQEPEFRGHRRFIKAAFDRLAAAFLLLCAAPVMLTIALAVRLTSPGPALYRHRRIGKRGREFDVLKFRSMVSGADAGVEALMVRNEGNAVQFKMKLDPRVTRVGKALRRYSLDELPQLLNVLKGDMSLVGPRPHVTREVEQYGPDMHRRLLVKPGITGLWQVSGRSDLTWEESVELDVRYVENWSLGLDLTILWRTVRAVVKSAGAY